ncbi:MAG: hypothetical protein DWC11_01770 [Candidatus Poseidoniales archaeon]|nr:MAG: hypothetical protein DWC11_01770 [Candidatus Poseidoniales archaeon]
MNKGLTITGAVFLVLSLLGVVVGGAMASNSVASLEDMDELEDPWNYENATSGTITYDDADGMGELGFYFYIDTPMKDDDGDGEGDACVAFFDDGGSVSVTRDGETGASNEFTRDCSMPEPGEDGNVDQGMTRIGYACNTLSEDSDCTNGDYSFTASSGVHVMYVDPVLAALVEGLGALFGGGALASAAACCGLPLGLILLIVGLVTSSGPAPMPAQAYGQATIMPTTLGAAPAVPGMQTYAPAQPGMVTAEQPVAHAPAVAEPEAAKPWDHAEGPL